MKRYEHSITFYCNLPERGPGEITSAAPSAREMSVGRGRPTTFETLVEFSTFCEFRKIKRIFVLTEVLKELQIQSYNPKEPTEAESSTSSEANEVSPLFLWPPVRQAVSSLACNRTFPRRSLLRRRRLSLSPTSRRRLRGARRTRPPPRGRPRPRPNPRRPPPPKRPRTRPRKGRPEWAGVGAARPRPPPSV